MSKWSTMISLMGVILWFFTGISVLAQTAEPDYPVYPNHSRVKWLQSSAALSPQEPTWIGMHILLDKDWHAYWQNPGDSGAAPILDFQPSSDQLEIGDIQWPIPQRIDTPPLTTFGYSQEVLLFLPLQLKTSLPEGTPLELAIDAEWLVCKEECIPAFDSFKLRFKATQGPVNTNGHWPVFQGYFKTLPEKTPLAASYGLQDKKLDLSLSELPEGAIIRDIFPLTPEVANHRPQRLQAHIARLTLEQPLQQERDKQSIQIKGLVHYELKGVQHAAYWQATEALAPIDSAFDANTSAIPLWQFWLMALVGGAILNLMPCVFPILAIKLLGILQQGQEKPALVRAGSLAYILGVILSFLAFALILVGLRAGGQALGWGFQLQSPWFLTALIFLFFVLSLHFMGLFELRFALHTGAQTSRYPLWGQFSAGLLSVLVASPCTAPFMGAAMGFALTQSIPVILSVYLMLGLGFALPFLGLLVWPNLVKFLPKPGAWMLTLKSFMTFPMLMTTIWLLWVLGKIQGIDVTVLVLASLTVLAIPFWYQSLETPVRALQGLSWLVCIPLALGLSLYPQLTVPEDQKSVQTASDFWQPFSPELLETLKTKQAVFVDFTAAWCITCQVNERVTFRSPAVKTFIAQHNIAMIKADWTKRDPEITRVLETYGRISVPFYLLFTPGKDKPHILPEVLTPDIFLNALNSELNQSTEEKTI